MAVGGAERQLAFLAAAQARRGYDVHVTLAQGGPHLDALIGGGVRVHQIRARGNHDPSIGIQLLVLLRSLRPEIVQTWLPQMDIIGGSAALVTRRKWVLTERSTAAAYSTRFKDRVVRAAIGRLADAVIANSEAGAEYWRTRLRSGTIAVVPNAVPLDEIRRATPGGLGRLAETAEPFVLFAGRLASEKDPLVVLRALSRARAVTPVTAVFCGSGPLKSRLLQEASELNLLPHVLTFDHCSELWGLMKSAGALVAPSRFEGHPNVVLEAAAAGCPLILSDIEAHRRIAGESSALYFTAGSAEELAEAILRTLANATDASRRVACASEIVSHLAVEAAVEAYEGVYETLRGRRVTAAMGLESRAAARNSGGSAA